MDTLWNTLVKELARTSKERVENPTNAQAVARALICEAVSGAGNCQMEALKYIFETVGTVDADKRSEKASEE